MEGVDTGEKFFFNNKCRSVMERNFKYLRIKDRGVAILFYTTE